MADRIITVIQEKLNNSTLTVSVDGVAVGRVLEDRPGVWVALPLEPTRKAYPTLIAAIDALVGPEIRA